MGRYISLDELQKFPQRYIFDEDNASADFIEGTNTVIKYAENLESVNIVRCKECIHYTHHHLDKEAFGCYESGSFSYHNPYDFCSDGVRR